MSVDRNALVETSSGWHPCVMVRVIIYSHARGDICCVQSSTTCKNLKRQKLPVTSQFPKNSRTQEFHWLFEKKSLISFLCIWLVVAWDISLLSLLRPSTPQNCSHNKCCLLFEKFFQSCRLTCSRLKLKEFRN